MARSSRPRRPYRSRRPDHCLVLTRGGGAELIELETDETVWASDDDEDFMEEFPDFLEQSDVFDVLAYLEEIGELTAQEADACEVREEYFEPADLTGMFR